MSTNSNKTNFITISYLVLKSYCIITFSGCMFLLKSGFELLVGNVRNAAGCKYVVNCTTFFLKKKLW